MTLPSLRYDVQLRAAEPLRTFSRVPHIVCDLGSSVNGPLGDTDNATSVMEDAHLWLGGVKVVSESPR
jgi:hypothetical protein